MGDGNRGCREGYKLCVNRWEMESVTALVEGEGDWEEIQWPGAWIFLCPRISVLEMQRGYVAFETPSEWCVALLWGTPEPTMCSQQGFKRHWDSLVGLKNLVDGLCQSNGLAKWC